MLQYIISLDIKLLNLLRGLVDPANLELVKFVTYLTDSGIFLVAGLLVIAWLYGSYKKDDSHKEDSLMIFYSIAFAFIIYIILNRFLPVRPRPETVSAIRPLIDHLPDNSFPSGHAIFAGASIVAFFIYSRKKLVAWLVLIVSLIMLLSRIVAGIHYPTDIIVGLIIGIVGAILVYPLRESNLFVNYLFPIPLKIASLFHL